MLIRMKSLLTKLELPIARVKSLLIRIESVKTRIESLLTKLQLPVLNSIVGLKLRMK